MSSLDKSRARLIEGLRKGFDFSPFAEQMAKALILSFQRSAESYGLASALQDNLTHNEMRTRALALQEEAVRILRDAAFSPKEPS